MLGKYEDAKRGADCRAHYRSLKMIESLFALMEPAFVTLIGYHIPVLITVYS